MTMMPPPNRAIQHLAELLSHHTGQALSESRRWRIETSLRPLMRDRQIPSLDALVAAINRAPDGSLLIHTIDAMLNHESSFFRDIAVFQGIEQQVLPRLREQLKEKLLRIWCAGCSTGQEAYSLAMMIKRMGALWDGWRISIHATDVSTLAIDKATRGRYPQMDMQRGLPISDLLRWFRPVADEWQISDEIREMVHFQDDNLLEPRKISGSYDLILCRNVLFYFPKDKRTLACDNIARHARPGSYLVLGAGEMLTGGNNPFASCRELSCVYLAERPARGIGRLTN